MFIDLSFFGRIIFLLFFRFLFLFISSFATVSIFLLPFTLYLFYNIIPTPSPLQLRIWKKKRRHGKLEVGGVEEGRAAEKKSGLADGVERRGGYIESMWRWDLGAS